jgi:hypothetical protein
LRSPAVFSEIAVQTGTTEGAGRDQMARPKVAAILTEYRPLSHADVIVTKLLEGYDLYGSWTEPRIEVASIYLDQVPENDIGVGYAEKHGVPIFDSIGEAIAVGDSGVNVDGVLLIGEHGDYPYNEREQKLYPRRRFFDAASAAMVGAGTFVPVFNDKHLSWSFPHAKRMYDTANRLGIPFLAGSSVPVAWRRPSGLWPFGEPVSEALAVGYGGIEVYGFHTLEALQCILERRSGGETGVRSVQCLSGDDVWRAADAGTWSRDMLEGALEPIDGPTAAEVPDLVPEPAAFIVEYRDGVRATVLMLDGAIRQFGVAVRGEREFQNVGLILEGGRPHGHFTFLVRQIESLMLERRSPYPVDRTLLTTGILDAAMRSRHEGHTVIDTPELDINYHAPEQIIDTGNGAELPKMTKE